MLNHRIYHGTTASAPASFLPDYLKYTSLLRFDALVTISVCHEDSLSSKLIHASPPIFKERSHLCNTTTWYVPNFSNLALLIFLPILANRDLRPTQFHQRTDAVAAPFTSALARIPSPVTGNPHALSYIQLPGRVLQTSDFQLPDRVLQTAHCRKMSSCNHRYSSIKSDSSILTFICSMCHSGPYWAIFQCEICKKKVCDSCKGKC